MRSERREISASYDYEACEIQIPMSLIDCDVILNEVNARADSRIMDELNEENWRHLAYTMPRNIDRALLVDMAKECIEAKDDEWGLLDFMRFIHDTYEELTRQT